MSSLANKWIVITRPEGQADNLKSKLESVGANVVLFPLIEINPPDDLSLLKEKLSKLLDYDLIVFVSPNAVKYGLKFTDVKDYRGLKVAAIGNKTKALLESSGVHVDYSPEHVSNSETFLSIPELIHFSQDKSIAIFRGNNGRELIRTELLKHAKVVDYFDVYARSFPNKSLCVLKEYYDRNELDVILISSGQALSHLFSFESENKWLNQTRLLLGSDRIKQQLKTFSNSSREILISLDPSDDAVFNTLHEWASLGPKINNG